MSEILRPAVLEDASEAGRICYEAFKAIAEAHNFPLDFPSAAVATGLLEMLLQHPAIHGVVAERDGVILGSNFMDERTAILGIGPITVDPAAQNAGIGRRLMQVMLDRATERNAAGVRLVQVAYHNRSLSRYTSLGFRSREPLSLMQGPPPRQSFPGYNVRPARIADLDACNALCREVHGFNRGGELADAIGQNTAAVVEHLGRITGYTTMVGFGGHTVGASNQDVIALIGAATEFSGPGFLLPTRNYTVFSWCLAHGLKLVQQTTLMSVGLYQEPAGGWLPSIWY